MEKFRCHIQYLVTTSDLILIEYEVITAAIINNWYENISRDDCLQILTDTVKTLQGLHANVCIQTFKWPQKSKKLALVLNRP